MYGAVPDPRRGLRFFGLVVAGASHHVTVFMDVGFSIAFPYNLQASFSVNLFPMF